MLAKFMIIILIAKNVRLCFMALRTFPQTGLANAGSAMGTGLLLNSPYRQMDRQTDR
jgi:hypothetical protein